MTFYIDSIAEGSEGYIFGYRPKYDYPPLTSYRVKGIANMTDENGSPVLPGNFPAEYGAIDDAFIYVSYSAIAAGYTAINVYIDDDEYYLTFAADGNMIVEIGDEITLSEA